jgi:DNA-binding response OmpR family regulator
VKILIVEDEEKIAKAIKRGLEQENFSADVCFDGLCGYDMASSEEYDVIILDLMLPKMSGEEITQKLRNNQIETPILMLTAKSLTENKVAGLNIGADDYLTKPFEFKELVARVNALARRPKNLEDELINCADLSLNINTKEVKRNNKLLNLSKKEYLLLEYLLRNKNIVLSKEQLIENVWEFDADILPNTVEVYIKYLRNKIDKNHDKKLIQTVRGFGYKLEE